MIVREASSVPTLSVRALCWVQPRSTVEFRGALARESCTLSLGLTLEKLVRTFKLTLVRDGPFDPHCLDVGYRCNTSPSRVATWLFANREGSCPGWGPLECRSLAPSILLIQGVTTMTGALLPRRDGSREHLMLRSI
jgi:hypothetical protein